MCCSRACSREVSVALVNPETQLDAFGKVGVVQL